MKPTGENSEGVWMQYCDMLLRRAVQVGTVEGREGFEMSRGLFRAALELIESDGWQKDGEIQGKIMKVLKQAVKRMGAIKDRMGDRLGRERGDLWRLDLMQFYVHLYEWQGKEMAAHWARIDLVNEQKKFEKKFEPKRKVQETDTVTKRQRTEMRNLEDDTAEGAIKEEEEEMEATGNDWEKLPEEKAGDEGEEDWEEDKSLTREVFPRVREIFDSDEEEVESERDEKGADREGDDDDQMVRGRVVLSDSEEEEMDIRMSEGKKEDRWVKKEGEEDAGQRLKEQIAWSRVILSDSDEEEMEIRMSEGKKDEGGVKREVKEDEDQILENHIYLEHNDRKRGLKADTDVDLGHNDIRGLKIQDLKAETDNKEKNERKQRLKDLLADWDEEEAKTELETKVKIDQDIRDAEDDTRGAVTLGPWRFQLGLEEEEWGNLRLPTTRKEVEMTSSAGSSGRRSLRRMKRRGSTTTTGLGSGIRASHQ